ncbi:MAG: hypothetical protein ACE5G2_01920 [Candidatus Krumholzibacteriia bacterium]
MAVLLLSAFLLGPPDSNPTSKNVEQPVPRPGAVTPPLGSAPEEAPADAERRRAGGWSAGGSAAGVLEVVIDLEGGEFEIVPAAPGAPIRVEAEYDEGLYRLEPSFSSDPERGDRFGLLFERRGQLSLLRQIVYRRHEQAEGWVRVHLPSDVPMDLSVRIRKGEAELDLSGLALRMLEVDHGMGTTQLSFDEPSPVPMDVLEIKAKMGELAASGLGHAGARRLRFAGKMGDFRLDMRGPWRTDTSAEVRITMGSALVRVPRDVRVELTNRRVVFGNLEARRDDPRGDPELRGPGKTLLLETSVRFGEMVIR